MDELRRIVCGAFSVLVKDKPVPQRSINTKLNATGDSYLSAVFIECALTVIVRWFISFNTAATFLDFPTLKVMYCVLNCVGHINCIALSCIR